MFALRYNSLPMKTTVIKKLLCLTFYALPVIAFAANFTEPRTGVSQPRPQSQRTQNTSLPVKVTIYKAYRGSRERFTKLARLPAGPLPLQSRLQDDRPSPWQVKAYVRTKAVDYGVNPQLALWIVRHESHFNPRAKGDGEASRGLWQISKIYHPEVFDEQAFIEAQDR